MTNWLHLIRDKNTAENYREASRYSRAEKSL